MKRRPLIYSTPNTEYINYAHDIRGRVINSIAEMEQKIDSYICAHFCDTKEKRAELREIIIATSKITFKDKVDILCFLLEKTKELTKKEVNRAKHNLMQVIAPLRNVLAHCELDTSPASISKYKRDEETVYFSKYANEKKVVAVGKKEVLEILELTQSMIAFLGFVQFGKT